MFAKNILKSFQNQNSSQKIIPLLLAATGFTLASQYKDNLFQSNTVSCCGIIGVLTKKNNAEDVLVDGIQILQNRGYDSAGVTTLQQGKKEFLTTKLASQESSQNKVNCIKYLSENVPQKHKNSIAGIAHTRWATCGAKTDANSHPHLNSDNSIAIVHNGVIDNYCSLKEKVENDYKVTLRSETDSELIAHVISQYQKQNNSTLKDAIKDMIKDNIIQGTWGLVAMDNNNPEQMVVARRGSPINIGVSDEAYYVASEKVAFQKLTDKYFSLKENEIIELDLNNHTFDKERILINKDKVVINAKPKEGYSSFFEQEIDEQQQSIMDTLGKGARLRGKSDTCKLGGLEQYQQQISELENLIIVACGSSYQASCYAATYLKKLRCLSSIQCIEGSEFNKYDLPQGKSAIVIVSQSGETADLRKALVEAKKQGIFSIGIINAVGSHLAESVDCGIYLNCGREVAVAATKSFTSQISALIMLSVFISEKKDKFNSQDLSEKQLSQSKEMRKKLIKSLQLLPVTMQSTLSDIEETCKKSAYILSQQSTLICLGKGPCSSIAKEGALKIKELTYIHAEAFSAGELKHGPLALIDPERPKSTCILLIMLDDEHLEDMNICLSEVHSRQAQTLIITDCQDKLNKNKTDFIFPIQNAGQLTSMLCVLAFYKITLEICQIKGLNPDLPRNLAKTVTV